MIIAKTKQYNCSRYLTFFRLPRQPDVCAGFPAEARALARPLLPDLVAPHRVHPSPLRARTVREDIACRTVVHRHSCENMRGVRRGLPLRYGLLATGRLIERNFEDLKKLRHLPVCYDWIKDIHQERWTPQTPRRFEKLKTLSSPPHRISDFRQSANTPGLAH